MRISMPAQQKRRLGSNEKATLSMGNRNVNIETESARTAHFVDALFLRIAHDAACNTTCRGASHTLVPATRDQRGTANPRPANQPNIHSNPNYPKISLDTASYKLYYVNYKMSRNFASVDCLWQSHKPSS